MLCQALKMRNIKEKKLSHKENLEIRSDNIISNTKNGRDGYINADQLFYFDKSKIDYYVFARVDEELLDELIRLIIELRYENKVKMNIKNLNNINETSNC